jgi:hypothetical protein
MGALTTYQFNNFESYSNAKKFYANLLRDEVTRAYVPGGMAFHKPPSYSCSYALADTYTPGTQSDINVIYAVAHYLLWGSPKLMFNNGAKERFCDELFKKFRDLKIDYETRNGPIVTSRREATIRKYIKNQGIRFQQYSHGRFFLLNIRMYNGTPIFLPPGGSLMPSRQWDESSLLLSVVCDYESAIIKTWPKPLDLTPMFKVTPLHQIFMVYQLLERLTILKHVMDYERCTTIINTLLQSIMEGVGYELC